MSSDLSKRERKDERSDIASVEPIRAGLVYSPRIDIWETDEELILLADLPGVAPEDLDIQFENRELRIHGRVGPRHEGLAFLGGEYGIGDFHRAFTIGQSIDPAKISAELNDGVLTLHLPKVEALKPRKIEVKSG